MVKLVTPPTQHADDRTCIWMDAGVLTYRLCDRDFDCEHCPLDSALRCDSRYASGTDFPAHAQACLAARFPADRVYSRSHTWLQTMDEHGSLMRFGVDEFATSFIDAPHRLRRAPCTDVVRSGEALCVLELDGGGLTLESPVTARVTHWNEAVTDDPSALIEDPFAAAWIAELTLDSLDDLAGLIEGCEARRRARFDVRRFRRRVAFELLADGATPNLVPAFSGLRQILGPERYLALVRELIH